MKHDDRRKLFGLTWIGWVNLLVFQWVGLRLAAMFEPPDDTHVGWTWRRWWPMSGWMPRWKIVSRVWLIVLILAALLLVSCKQPGPEVWNGMDRSKASCERMKWMATRVTCTSRGQIYLCLREAGSDTWECAAGRVPDLEAVP